MKETILFSDVSVDPIAKVGFGAYLKLESTHIDIGVAKELVKVRHFSNTSSTRLELQTLLWALAENDFSNSKLIIYTDSQNIVGLPGRRKRMEGCNFSNKKGIPLKNKDLYLKFYKILDELDLQLVKLKGHKNSGEKDLLDQLFSLVDKASRVALRDASLSTELKDS